MNTGNNHKSGLTFAVVASGVFISTLDSSMVNLALPAIMGTFHASLGRTEWVVLAYLMTISATLLFWGRIGDRIQRARLYAAGLFLFLCGSLAAFFSPSLNFLITARLAQGIGAAIIMACGPALIRDTTTGDRLGRRLGLIGMAVGLGLMCGPVVAWIIMDHLPWRFIFCVSLIPGTIAAAMALRLPKRGKTTGHGRIDYGGAILWGTGLLALTLFLSGLAGDSRKIAVYGSLGLFIITTILLIRHQRHRNRAFLPLEIISNRYFLLGIISAMISFAALFAAIFLLPFYLEHGRGISPSATGMVMLAVPVAAIIAAPIAGRLADHLSGPPIATFGLIISTAGLLGLATLSPDTPLSLVWIRLFVLGCGMAVFLAPNSAAVLGRLSRAQAGSGAALLATARNVGMLLGTSLAALMFAKIFAYLSGFGIHEFRPESLKYMVMAMRLTFAGAALVAAAGVFISHHRGRA